MHPEQECFQFLEQGVFMLQRSPSSDALVFYPRIVEPRTGATDLEWVQASGAGTVYSTTVVRQKKPPKTNYNLKLIDLAEGPRMLSRVRGVAPEDVKIGMAVRALVSQRSHRHRGCGNL